MKLIPILTSTAVAAALVFGTATASHADTPEGIAPLGHGAPSVAPDPTLEKLEALVGTQTKAELSAILNSGKPVEALFDTNTWEYVAAFTKPINLRAMISVVGPGCSTTSACAWANGTTPYGYSGSGSMNINLKKVNKISSGDRLTTFWDGAKGVFVAADRTATFSPAWNFNKITRG